MLRTETLRVGAIEYAHLDVVADQALVGRILVFGQPDQGQAGVALLSQLGGRAVPVQDLVRKFSQNKGLRFHASACCK